MSSKELIEIIVVVGEDEKPLTIQFEDNVLDFVLEGKTLFSCDYVGNFYEKLRRIEEIWKKIGEEYR